MRLISTKAHGVIDYVAGLLFIVSPWLFGFADGTAAQWVPVIIGIVTLCTSLITDYELGVMKVIPMPVHLSMDVIIGIIFIASPWILGFANRVMLPHLIFGVFAIGAGLMTRKHPYPAGAMA